MQIRPKLTLNEETKLSHTLESSRQMLKSILENSTIEKYRKKLDKKDDNNEFELILNSFLAFHKIPITDVIKLFLQKDKYAEHAIPVRLRRLTDTSNRLTNMPNEKQQVAEFVKKNYGFYISHPKNLKDKKLQPREAIFLSIVFMAGITGRVNTKAALSYAKYAVAGKDNYALRFLGDIYFTGIGAKQDLKKAKMHFAECTDAESRNANAMLELRQAQENHKKKLISYDVYKQVLIHIASSLRAAIHMGSIEACFNFKDLFDYISSDLKSSALKDNPVDYLKIGVAKGCPMSLSKLALEILDEALESKYIRIAIYHGSHIGEKNLARSLNYYFQHALSIYAMKSNHFHILYHCGMGLKDLMTNPYEQSKLKDVFREFMTFQPELFNALVEASEDTSETLKPLYDCEPILILYNLLRTKYFNHGLSQIILNYMGQVPFSMAPTFAKENELSLVLKDNKKIFLDQLAKKNGFIAGVKNVFFAKATKQKLIAIEDADNFDISYAEADQRIKKIVNGSS